jgi:hypothetical protein
MDAMHCATPVVSWPICAWMYVKCIAGPVSKFLDNVIVVAGQFEMHSVSRANAVGANACESVAVCQEVACTALSWMALWMSEAMTHCSVIVGILNVPIGVFGGRPLSWARRVAADCPGMKVGSIVVVWCSTACLCLFFYSVEQW